MEKDLSQERLHEGLLREGAAKQLRNPLNRIESPFEDPQPQRQGTLEPILKMRNGVDISQNMIESLNNA